MHAAIVVMYASVEMRHAAEQMMHAANFALQSGRAMIAPSIYSRASSQIITGLRPGSNGARS